MGDTNEDKNIAGETAERSAPVADPPSRGKAHHTPSFLFSKWFGVALAVMIGSAITAGTTCALALRIQHLIAHASVSSDPDVWIQTARTKGYDRCYLGCTKCDDPDYAYNACAKTAKVSVSGVTCDANRMWNWKDRYPTACLKALGEIYKKEALVDKKNGYKNQYAIIILTVLGGVVGGYLVYRLWKWTAAKAEAKQRWEPREWTPVPAEDDTNKDATGENSGSRRSSSSHSRSRKGPKILLTSLLAIFGKAPGAKAFHCTGYDASYQQYFTNSNNTVYGVVEGWISNCYKTQKCYQKCSTKCNDNGCHRSCKNVCHTETYSNKAPKDYVQGIMSSIRACGFEETDSVKGNVDLRVANPGIERNWWVMMSVNGYNITDKDDTDESIWCLHDIGNKS